MNMCLLWSELSYWYKRKKTFLWIIAAGQAGANHGEDLDSTLYFRVGTKSIYADSDKRWNLTGTILNRKVKNAKAE